MGEPQGILFVVSAPSGVGKTTLIRKVRTRLGNLRFSVSCTTRHPRAGEIPGEDYHFLSPEEFLQGIQRGRFLEWARVHGEHYGTDGDRVRRWLQQGEDVILDIDVQGASQVRRVYPWAPTLFVLPPSWGALRRRLEQRGTEDEEQLNRRLEAARREMEQSSWYDFIMVNDDLEEAAADMEAVLRAVRCHRWFQARRVESLLEASDS